MTVAALGTWTLQGDVSGPRLLTTACGRCRECQAGLSAWCRQTGGPEDVAAVGFGAGDPTRDLAGVACLSAVDRAGLGAADHLVILLSDGLPAWLPTAVGILTGAVVHAVGDLRDGDLKRELTTRPTGRADCVVVHRAVAAGVRAVRRGGVVCVGTTSPDMPTVTELVQREVRLIGPGGLSDRLLSALAADVGPDATA